MVLNHKVQGVAAVDDRHEGDGEKRRALLAWNRPPSSGTEAMLCKEGQPYDKEGGDLRLYRSTCVASDDPRLKP
jgi:hypothetical protein